MRADLHDGALDRPVMTRRFHAQIIIGVAMVAFASCTTPPSDLAGDQASPSSVAAGPRGFATGDLPELPSSSLAPSVTASLQDIIDAAVEDGKLPGITAAVIVADSGIWSGAAGTADRVNDLVPESQFHVGSISKAVIAAQVLRLVEDGVFALDDPVADHLPASLDFDTNGATIQQLLNMRSGIANPEEVPMVLGYDRRWIPIHPNSEWPPERRLETLKTLPAPANSPPGSKYEYSSTNFTLLRMAIEHEMRRPLAEVLRADVLADRGLERMIFQAQEHPVEPVAAPLSRRYQEDVTAAFEAGGGYLPSRFDSNEAIASDAPSLARWVYELFGGRVVSSDSLAKMTRMGRDGYGFGLYEDAEEWGIEDVALGHSGILIPAYSSYFVVLPEHGIVVVTLSNIADGNRDLSRVVSIGRELAEAVQPEL
jgi:D-alanyl-D-alanine carboxypeptidase